MLNKWKHFLDKGEKYRDTKVNSAVRIINAGDGIRTHKMSPSEDFESSASAVPPLPRETEIFYQKMLEASISAM
jgi:hypothetical protein